MRKIISTEREKRIFVISCIALLIFTAYRGIYVPLKDSEETTQDKILTLEKEFNKAVQTISKSQPYQQNYSEAMDCFNQSVSDKEQLTLIKKEIEGIAKDNHLQSTASDPLKSKTTPVGSDFTIEVSVQGTLNNIMDFLSTLQNCPHLYTVNEFQITKAPSSDSNLLSKLILTKSLIK